MDLTDLDTVKLQGKIPDARDDRWLALAITSVSTIMETEANRWLAPRGAMTRYFDGTAVRHSALLGSQPAYFGPMWGQSYGRVLWIPDGVSAAPSYVGVAGTDQPDDGTGSYTAITRGVHVRGAYQDGWPYTRLELDSTANTAFPSTGYNVVKVTADNWGPAAAYPRVRELATIAVVRAWRAAAGGDGGPDIVVVGPAGGTQVLRRIAPSEMEELVRNFGIDTRLAFASVEVG